MSAAVDLATAKSYAGIGHNTLDAMLQVLLDGAEEFVARWCNVRIAATFQTVTEYCDGGGNYLWPTSCLPIVAMTVAPYDMEAGAAYDGDIRYDSTKVWKKYGDWWPRGEQKWRLTYQGGYTASTIPAGLKNVILSLFYRAFHNQGGKASESAQGCSVNWQDLAASDLSQEMMPYRIGSTL